jgi:hypothetical protein
MTDAKYKKFDHVSIAVKDAGRRCNRDLQGALNA